MLEGRFGTTSSHLFRREALLRVGGWDATRRAAQEQDLLVRLLAGGSRVVFLPEAFCIKRRVNPRSLWRTVWRDDPKAAAEADVSAMANAVRHLREQGELTPQRKAAAGARFLMMARSAWQRGAGGWEEVLAAAETEGLPQAALLSGSPAAYRVVYRARGFQAAERLARAVERSRAYRLRWLRERRRGARRWLRHGRALAGAARRRLL